MVQVQPAQVERKVLQVQPAVRVQLVKKVLQEQPDQLVMQERKALQVQPDQQVVQVLLDHKGLKDKKVK